MEPLADLPLSRVKLVICDDYPVVRTWVQSAALVEEPFFRVIEIPDTAGLKIDSAMSLAVNLLSRAAQALWPDWVKFNERRRDNDEATGVDELTEWERQAAQLCQVDRPPLFDRLNLSVQAQRLSRVLDEQRLIILAPLVPPTVTESDLGGFAGFLEWLAIETRARVLAVVSTRIAEHPALERLRYGSLVWPSVATGPTEASSQDSGGSGPLVFPVIGKPHPFSPGEQLLARVLSQDSELGGLFLYNQPILSAKGHRFIVDLFWPDGRIVVEVDGYLFHSDQAAFSSDRQRDYELVLSECLVLRLTHDEVIEDVSAAIGKIRDLVRFRRLKGLDVGPNDTTSEEYRP